MGNRKYTLCLDCGKVQVRTDIIDIIKDHYVRITETDLICPGCIGKRHIATDDMKGLVKDLSSKQNMTSLDKRVLFLARKR